MKLEDLKKCAKCGKPFKKAPEHGDYAWVPTCDCDPDLIKNIG